jgi:hypothetical protein
VDDDDDDDEAIEEILANRESNEQNDEMQEANEETDAEVEEEMEQVQYEEAEGEDQFDENDHGQVEEEEGEFEETQVKKKGYAIGSSLKIIVLEENMLFSNCRTDLEEVIEKRKLENKKKFMRKKDDSETLTNADNMIAALITEMKHVAAVSNQLIDHKSHYPDQICLRTLFKSKPKFSH